jgi:hypothetical protein
MMKQEKRPMLVTLKTESPTLFKLSPEQDAAQADRVYRFKRDDGTLGSFETTYDRFPRLRVGDYLVYHCGGTAQRRVIFQATGRSQEWDGDEDDPGCIDTVKGLLAVEITPGLGWFVQLPGDEHALNPEYRSLLDLFDRVPLTRRESDDAKLGIHFISDELAEIVVTKCYDQPFYRFTRREGARSLEPFIVAPEALIQCEPGRWG